MSTVQAIKVQSSTPDVKSMPTARHLEPAEYALWDELVQNSPQGSVFCHSSWLEAVGQFRILGYFEEGKLIAGIPLYFERRFGVRICTLPRLTPTLGIVIRELPGNANKLAARHQAIVRAIAKELSEYRLFFQAMHPSLTDWLPFYWEGFRQTTRYTYVIDDLTDLNKVWNEMNGNTRNHITKAEKAGIRVMPCGIDDVYKCEYESHLKRGTTPRHSQDVLRRIHDAAFQHSAGSCSAAYDRDGQVLAAFFLAWDNNRTYQLVGGNSTLGRNSSAGFAVIWQEIQSAAKRSRVYDFSGSMMEGVSRFNKGFGTKQVPCHFITKAPPSVYCALQLAGKL